MKALKIVIIMASLWTIFSCKNKPNRQVDKVGISQLQSKEDSVTKKVSQNIFNEKVAFDYSDFHDLKHNKSYDRFLAGQVQLPTGQVVCTDPMYRELALPQSWTVNKGQYPVYLYIGLEGDFTGRVVGSPENSTF